MRAHDGIRRPPARIERRWAFEARAHSRLTRVHGLASSANHSAKRLTFLLFINKRLVESSALKRAVEDAYAQYLPKGAHPLVYLSLRLPPAALDVNVHPTKREVHFLEQEPTAPNRATRARHGPLWFGRPRSG